MPPEVRHAVPDGRYPAGPVSPTLSGVGVVATIENVTLEVDPGSEVTSEVRIRNTGMVVDRVLLEVLGAAAEWARVEPPQLNLLPGTDATAVVTFRPPRSPDVPAGEVDYAVRARSQEDPAGSVVEEGTVAVAPYTELTAELEPRKARARRAARFQLVVTNLGNHPVSTEFSALDADLLLNFRIRPPACVCQPGTSTYIKLRAAPRKRFTRGPDQSLPFQAFVLPEADDPITADGAVLQTQLMPKWLLPAIGLAIAAFVVLVALWFLLLKPTVQSTAVQAAAQQNAELAAGVTAANRAATEASRAAVGANGADAGDPGGGGGGAVPAGSAGSPAAKAGAGSGGAATGRQAAATSPANAAKPAPTNASAAAPAPVPSGNPVSALLASDAPPTKAATFATTSYALPAGQRTLDVSDLVLQNPLADSGILQIRAGSRTLLEFGLDDFRNLDLHFVQPLVFTARTPLTLAVECLNTNATNCSAAVSFSGTTTK